MHMREKEDKGYKIKFINGNDTITSNPARLRILKEYAFKDLVSLERIILPPSLQIIERGAFENCTSLICVDLIKTQLVEINNIFGGCINLEIILLPDTVLRISDNTFGGLQNLKVLMLPERFWRNEAELNRIIGTNPIIRSNLQIERSNNWEFYKNLAIFHRGMVETLDKKTMTPDEIAAAISKPHLATKVLYNKRLARNIGSFLG
jgi:hypothetical protein